jgi:hypothetical protein
MYTSNMTIRAESEDKLVTMKVTDFWNLRPCGLIEAHQRFRGSCRLRHFIMAAAESSAISVHFPVYTALTLQKTAVLQDKIHICS